jgi:hypothetical protein
MWFVLTAVPNIYADQVSLVGGSGYGPYQTGIGGEFTLQPDAGLSWVLSFYNANPTTQTKDVMGLTDTFQSFCVEINEHIYPYATYDATISQNSIYTGVTLSLGAAWLYDQFVSGTLQNYDYTRANTATVQDLQTAIWYFMGVAAYDPLNQYIQLADTTFGTDADALVASAGAYNVAVLNLWNPGQVGTQDGARQDQLVIVPEPTTLALTGLAFGALLLLRRKNR